jgi:hypothetical protein
MIGGPVGIRSLHVIGFYSEALNVVYEDVMGLGSFLNIITQKMCPKVPVLLEVL